MFEQLKNKLKKDYNNQKFPFISTSLIIGASGIYYFGRKDKTNRPASSILDYFTISISKLIKLASISDKVIPILPKQDSPKPVFIFDLDNFLISKKFDLLRMSFSTSKRAYSDVFLFHMAHMYELIVLSKNSIDQKIVEKIDPYGCISYRVFLKNINEFKVENLNRDLNKTIVVCTEQDSFFNKGLVENTINIKKWNGEQDQKLMELLNFCSNLAIMNPKDFRNTIKSYKGVDFFKTYDYVQKKIFKQKNIFTFNYDKSYKDKIKKVTEERVKEFKFAKIEMDQHIIRDKLSERTNNIGNRVFNFCLNMIF